MPIEKIKKSEALIERIEQFLQLGYVNNEEFNAALCGDEAITIRSLKDPEQVYQYNASELLFWTDRATYMDELDGWNSEQIKQDHTAAIQYLADTKQQAVFSDLVELIRRNKISPFVGAGISKAAGYPLWSEALVELGNKISSVDESRIQELVESNQYLEAAQIVFGGSEYQLNNYIQTTFRTGFDKDEDRERIPRLFNLIPRLSTGCIVTTNFDCLIEEAFKLKMAPLVDGYMHGIQPGHNFVQRLLKGDRCILKLHGDATQPSTYVFTEQQYKSAYGDPIDYSNQLPKALRQIYISNSLLFLGCSLSQDKTLGLFKEVKDGLQFDIPDHFAIICSSGNLDSDQATEDRLLDLKIRPIWYDSNNDHALATQLVELAVDVAGKRLSLG